MEYKETPFGKIPVSWDLKPINEVTSVVTDYVTNGSFASLAKNVNYKDEEDEAVLIRLVDYNNDFEGNFVFIDEHAYEFLGKSKLYGDEIIISNVGANVGTVFKCPRLKYKMSLGPNAITVKFKDNNDFYYYWLLSSYGQFSLRSLVTGSAQPKFNKTNFRSMMVPVPPQNIQDKIASILSKFDEKISVNSSIIKNLQKQMEAVFKEWFIDSPDAEAWEYGTFSDLIVSTLGGDWGKENETGNFTSQVYCIRGADIPEVNKGNKGKMPVRYILPKNFKNKKLEKGDLVVEISGGSPTQSTGRIAAITSSLLERYDKGMVCTNFCRAMKPKSGYSMFLYFYWRYLYDRKVFFAYENGTTGIKNLDFSGFIDNEEIKIPPYELVTQFEAICEKYFSDIYARGLENEKLTEARNGLAERLMEGSLEAELYKG